MLKVTWDSSVCSHAGVCVNSLPQVFSVDQNGLKIDVEAAEGQRLIDVCNACPSGALQVTQE